VKRPLHIVGRLGPALAVAAALAGFATELPDDDSSERLRLEAVAGESRDASTDRLLAASDLIVEGVVVDIAPGRVLTSELDPAAGVATQLVTFSGREVDSDEPTTEYVIEQVVALADGTAATDAVDPLHVGEAGVAFLVNGGTERFPYTAFTGEGAWLPMPATELGR
jgi:hypothetical protein